MVMKKILSLLVLWVLFWWFVFASQSLQESISRMNNNWLTKYSNENDFRAENWLRRDEASKFFVQYAKEVLHLPLDVSNTSCDFKDLNLWHQDLQSIVKESCQLWLFQWYEGNFMPTEVLTNAQAITVLIRMIDWKKDEKNWHYADNYYEKAKNFWIMNWLQLNSKTHFDKATTRGEVGRLLFNSSKLDFLSWLQNSYVVNRIIDWDTIEILSWGKKEKIRLIGIDTPETVDSRKSIECFWKESSAKLTELLLGKRIILKNDETQADKDIYNRYLRYIFTTDGMFINQQIIENWYAIEYTYKTPYTYQSVFKNAEQAARNNKLWMWADTACKEHNTTPNWIQPFADTITKSSFYTSSHYSSKLYYCANDSGRQGLSPKYLRSYTNEKDLLNDYPTKKLHQPC